MKREYQPKTKKRARVHGFRKRSQNNYGQTTLKRRRQKGRAKLTTV